jgi:hypothetical protein
MSNCTYAEAKERSHLVVENDSSRLPPPPMLTIVFLSYAPCRVSACHQRMLSLGYHCQHSYEDNGKTIEVGCREMHLEGGP